MELRGAFGDSLSLPCSLTPPSRSPQHVPSSRIVCHSSSNSNAINITSNRYHFGSIIFVSTTVCEKPGLMQFAAAIILVAEKAAVGQLHSG